MEIIHSYIKEIKLSGYKSIKNVSYDFNHGLNIIIGNNGSGKTNLLKFIDRIFKRNYEGLDLFSAKINVSKAGLKFEDYSWIAENSLSKKNNLQPLKNNIESLKNDLELVEPKSEKNFKTSFISYQIPKEIPIISNEYSLKFDVKSSRVLNDSFSRFAPYSLLLFPSTFNKFFFENKQFINEINENELKKVLNDYLEKDLVDIKYSLFRFTPVEDFRFNDSARLSKIDSGVIEFRNIVFEYKVNNEWFDWNGLSDGTKRLIYIIFFISPLEYEHFLSMTDPLEITRIYEVILLEEPELGIHPHQLHLLLTFLKEQSKSQQIIITTHSPQVLDMLDKSELNNIGIAEIDYEKGTTLRHLTNEEIEKATYYLENNGMLSDYWRFSDFQRQKNSK